MASLSIAWIDLIWGCCVVYLEQDGLLLLVGVLTALAIVAGATIFAWETLSATGWLPGLL
ncbi:MAG: hypothetical protein JOZ58_16430 [Acetobacteraceae bacterium]|nr:hypothetical protein [Acetobacteraceae bacterium]MBV8576605.1 hypothetical protein [Acetobacteraceae bacterium]